MWKILFENIPALTRGDGVQQRFAALCSLTFDKKFHLVRIKTPLFSRTKVVKKYQDNQKK